MTEPQIRVEVLEVGPNKVSVEETNYHVTIDEQEASRVFVALPGVQGPPGTSIVTGNTDPNDGLGKNGDLYLNLVTREMWGPKANGTWGEQPLFMPATNRFVFSQAVPSDVWVINHDLGGKPSVTVVDSSSTTVYGEVNYVSDAQVVVSFSAPFAGEAYLT